MEHKSHKKLYKSGKLWVAATIATTALAGGLATTQTANADTVGTPQPTFNAPSAQAAQPNIENTPAAELQATTKDQQDSDAKQAAVTKADDVVKKAQVVPEIKVSDAYVKTVKQLEADLNAYAKDNPTRLNDVAEYADGYSEIMGINSSEYEISKLTRQQVAETFLDSALNNHLLEVDKDSSKNWNSTHYKVADYQGWSDKDKNTVVVDNNGQSSERNLDKLTKEQKIELTTLAAALINQVRQQVGVAPLKVTDASIDLGDLIVNNSNVPVFSDDFKPLQQNINVYATDKYGLATYKSDSQEIQGSEIFSSYNRSDNRNQLTMADLKNGIYKAIVSSLFLGGGDNRGKGDDLLPVTIASGLTPLLHSSFAIQKDGESVPTQMYLSLSLKAEDSFGTTSQRYGFNVFANASHRKDANVNGVVATKNLGKEYVATPLSGDKGNTNGANTNIENTPATVGTPQPTFNAPSAQAAQPAKDTMPVDAVEGLSAQELQELHDRQSQPEVQVADATNKGQVTVAKAGTKDVKSATTKQAVSAVKAQPARAAQAKALPQTGNDSANASVLGLAGVAMLSMIGLAAKRKF